MTSQAPQNASSSTRLPTRVHIYTEDELEDLDLSARCQSLLGKTPFAWQLDVATHLLLGDDVVLDVGTGNGKSLTFALPLLANDTDMNLVVSPLTALMIDQVRLPLLQLLSPHLTWLEASTAAISTVAVCAETIAAVGRDKIFEVRKSRASRNVAY